MKLQTKFQDEDFELGEVVNADIATMPDGRIKLQALAKKGGFHTIFYDSLEKIYSEWQDYKEPKGIQGFTTQGEDIIIRMGSIEEAEKAVEKLEAWTRLKDKGFRFISLYGGSMSIDYTLEGKVDDKVMEDLKLLFNGIRGEE